MNATQMEPKQARRIGWMWWGVGLHAVVLTVMSAQLLWWDLHPTIDANIGAGFLAFAVAAFGFPWSVLVTMALNTTQTTADIALMGAAAVNVAIHAAIIWRLSKPAED